MLFERERQRIEKAIGHIAAGVHHVGSTAIPGMPAKPILDIAVLLNDFDDGERCIEPLAKIGYFHMGVMDDIPVPECSTEALTCLEAALTQTTKARPMRRPLRKGLPTSSRLTSSTCTRPTTRQAPPSPLS